MRDREVKHEILFCHIMGIFVAIGRVQFCESSRCGESHDCLQVFL